MLHWYTDVVAKKYATFDGRAGRQEFWMFFLANIIVNFVINIVEVLHDSEHELGVDPGLREPGARAKIAVRSFDSRVDPVGACVGMKGMRVQSIIRELRGEKIDVIRWSQDPGQYIANSLSPARVEMVRLVDPEGQHAHVLVPPDQLSLAIGKEGQNARLAARLTGVRIDIRGESQPIDGLDEGDYEEGEWVSNPDTGAMEWHAADGTVLTQAEWNQQAEAASAAAAEAGRP